MGYTSSKVKQRWNEKHYDSIAIKLPIGSRAEMTAIAKAHGMSLTQFLRWAVLQAATEEERRQSPVLSGRKPEECENGYVSPFPPPPRSLIDAFFGEVIA